MKGKTKKKQESLPLKDYKYFDLGLLILFAAFVVLFTTFKISGDDDVFWHLATGRYIVETGSVPSSDVFGFVTSGQEWMPFEWGWDVLSYGLYNAGGYAALSIFRTLVFLAVFFVLLQILRKFNIPIPYIILFLIILAFGMIDRLTPRPHIMTYLFLSLTLYILFIFYYFKKNNNKLLYFLPAIFLVWANMHMGVLAGIFLLFVFTLSAWIQFYKNDKKALDPSQLKLISIIFAACIITLLINPNFFQTYLYAYSHTKMKLLETINEWKSPFDNTFSDFVNNIYKIFLFGGLIILYYALRKKDYFAGLLFIAFAIYSVRAVRFTVDYMLVIFVFLVISTHFLFINKDKVKQFFNSNILRTGLAAVLLLLIFNIPNNKLYLEHLTYYRISGFGINSDFIPVQLFDFMKQNSIADTGEKPFNHFGTGGYLVWNFPGKQNFIDSRNLNDEIFYEYQSLMAMSPGFDKKIANYNFDYAIYLSPDLIRAPNEMQQTIVRYFSTNADWKLVFWDDKSFLFVKNLPKFKEVIDKYAYSYVTPYNFGFNKPVIEKGIKTDNMRFTNELSRKLAEDPNSVIVQSYNQQYGKFINN